MVPFRQLRILIAPLDWGLGHTTRCTPIISHLLECGHTPVFAGNEWQMNYIEQIFPTIEKTYLQGYDVTWTNSLTHFLLQTGRLRKQIKNEQAWLNQNVGKLRLDGVISDNRYGLFSQKISCVFITHQPGIMSGCGSSADKFVRLIHNYYLSKFNEVWIADKPGAISVGGGLSHAKPELQNSCFIGLLSGFSALPALMPDSNPAGFQDFVLILISGPEPQRSLFSELLWQQALAYPGNVVFVEGSEIRARSVSQIPGHVKYFGRLSQQSLYPIIQKAKYVVCRSGYSTVMDLIYLGKKAFLIPTPGQPEQLYLGKTLNASGYFPSGLQENFRLLEAIEKIENFPFQNPFAVHDFENFKLVLNAWLASL